MSKLKCKFLVLAILMAGEFILSRNTHANPEIRTTTTGAVFTHDTSHPDLGEAWRDPDGLVWGDIVKNEDGSVRYMVQSSEYMKENGSPLSEGILGAKEYCESIGARLPSKEEFTRLRERMGAQSGPLAEGYSPQILPNLSGNNFWSSSLTLPYTTTLIDVFYGGPSFLAGFLGWARRANNVDIAVRCVARPLPPVCGTLEECQTLHSYLQEQLIQQESEVVRALLQSQLTQINVRIEKLLHPPDPEKRTTTTGAVFTHDTSHAVLGEAWRDPDGLVWGDIVKNEDGSVRYMVQSSEYMKERGEPLPKGTLGAKEYCEGIGTRLPSKEEFTRLREYMGAQSGIYKWYRPRVFPNLSGHWFWSSSVDPNVAGYAYDFDGSGGLISSYYRTVKKAVRCVVSR